MKRSTTNTLRVWALSLALISPVVLADSVEEAQRLYDTAQQQIDRGDLRGAESSLTEALSQRSGHMMTWFQLGRVQQALNQPVEAEHSFRQAFALAETDTDKAEILAYVGKALEQQGKTYEAYDMLKSAQRLHPNAPDWLNQLKETLYAQVDRQGGVTKGSIVAALSDSQKMLESGSMTLVAGDASGVTTTTAPPGVDTRIQFVRDSTAFIPESYDDLENLLAALQSPELSTGQFKLLGHTDSDGDSDYNQTLSERRALAVRDWLIARDARLASHLTTEGAGERNLLFPESGPAQKQLNRRVEVQALGPLPNN